MAHVSSSHGVGLREQPACSHGSVQTGRGHQSMSELNITFPGDRQTRHWRMFGGKPWSSKLLLDVERHQCIYTAAGMMEDVGCSDTTASPSVKLALAKLIS